MQTRNGKSNRFALLITSVPNGFGLKVIPAKKKNNGI